MMKTKLSVVLSIFCLVCCAPAKMVPTENEQQSIVISRINYILPPDATDLAEEFLADTLNSIIRTGAVLSEQDLASEVARSSAFLRSRGFYAIGKSSYSFLADTLDHPGSAVLDYVISEDSVPIRKTSIGEVYISYPNSLSINADVLNGINLVKPGQTYDETVVNTTYNRFSSMKFFSGVSIEMTQKDPETVDCEIALTPGALQGMKAHLEASTNSNQLFGISPRLSYYHKNLFGGGEWLNLGFSGNFQFMFREPTRANEFGMSASLTLPKFLGLSYDHFKGSSLPKTEISATFNYQDRPEYRRNILSTSYGYIGKFKSFGYQLYPLQFSYVRLYEMSDSFRDMLIHSPQLRYSYEDHFDAGVGGVLYTTSRHSTSQMRFDLSGNLVSLLDPIMKQNDLGQRLILGAPYTQYAKIELSHAQSIPLGKHTIAGRVLSGIGYAYGNSQTMPYEKQFYVGGANSMRGWQSRSLGPGSSPMEESFRIPSQTGNIKLEADIEWRFPIVWKIEGALFGEVGNVWNSTEGYTALQMVKTLAADWGLGVRLNIDILVVRFDWGLQLRDPVEHRWINPVNAITEGKNAFHFGVGYPF